VSRRSDREGREAAGPSRPRRPRRRLLTALGVGLVAGLILVALAVSASRSDPDPQATAGLAVTASAPATAVRAGAAAVDPDPGDHDRDDAEAHHPVRTQTVPGAQPIVFSPLNPIGSDNLTHVPRGWLVSEHRLASEGRVRSYLMIRPPSSAPGVLPVIMVLHGRLMTPADIERITRLIPLVGRAIYVYPAGYGRSWNAGGCCSIAHAARIDDVAFLEQVLHQVLTTQPAATSRRVYLMGFSNGGRMAYRMACQDPGVFAGVAAVEAVPVYRCQSLDPVPLVIVAQTADPLLTVAGHGPRKTMDGYLEPTVGATVTAWRAMDACGSGAVVRHVGLATVTRYQGCLGQGRVEYDLYRGNRHAWPAGNRRTPSASQFIWSYLAHDVLPVVHRPFTVVAAR
jgi:polyhydroxybutyrate depolymerase